MLSATTGVQPLYPNAHMSATTAASILLPSNQNNFTHFYTEHILSTHLHWPGARKKQHKETLAIPHNFYGNLVENEINDGESQIRIASGRCFADRCKVDEDTNIMGRS